MCVWCEFICACACVCMCVVCEFVCACVCFGAQGVLVSLSRLGGYPRVSMFAFLAGWEVRLDNANIVFLDHGSNTSKSAGKRFICPI